ncbi:hypothetical protein [Corallococcus llansteffanensis]|uniref:Lipoprotein n=1 Tax=Corallococcus llansteffanensis TaxID=2316731 RepID=A0A3A8PNW3_9BACT|nr:hypothetical protein [Corallococcus llansteffanensis]RKH57819.1 hypothetical protein D7V93_17900 [Corallococcus llansteffanensis]
MMRSDQRRKHAWGVLFLGLALAWATGCKKEQPAEAAVPVDAGVVAVAVLDAGTRPVDAGTVAKVVKPLRFSNVVISRQDLRVDVTYTLSNPGTAQGRGEACMTLLDEQGHTIEVVRLGGIVVKGGLEDTFEDHVTVDDLRWRQTRSVLLFTRPNRASCVYSSSPPTSEPMRLLPSGKPATADLPEPAPLRETKPEDLEVSDVEVTQDGTLASYAIRFTVKNVSDHRASGRGCLRAYRVKDSDAVDESLVGSFNLAAGASVTLTDSVDFQDDKQWDEVTVLRLFTSFYGCADEEETENPGFLFDKPAAIRSPVEEESADVEAVDDAAPAGEVTE